MQLLYGAEIGWMLGVIAVGVVFAVFTLMWSK